MAVIIKELNLEIGESFHLCPVPDAHIGSVATREDELIRHLKECSKLERPLIYFPGDLGEHIYAKDGRYKEGSRPRYPREFLKEMKMRGYHEDAALSIDIAWIAKLIKDTGIEVQFISPGNHADHINKYYAIDPVAELAEKLRVQVGEFSGWFFVRCRTRAGKCATYRVLYNHGSWGGSFAKGYNGAVRWAYAHEGWDAFTFGHLHAKREDIDPVRRTLCDGQLELLVPRVVVNCGSFKTHMEGMTTYAKRNSFNPCPISSTVIKVTLKRMQAQGHDVLYFDTDSVSKNRTVVL